MTDKTAKQPGSWHEVKVYFFLSEPTSRPMAFRRDMLGEKYEANQ